MCLSARESSPACNSASPFVMFECLNQLPYYVLPFVSLAGRVVQQAAHTLRVDRPSSREALERHNWALTAVHPLCVRRPLILWILPFPRPAATPPEVTG